MADRSRDGDAGLERDELLAAIRLLCELSAAYLKREPPQQDGSPPGYSALDAEHEDILRTVVVQLREAARSRAAVGAKLRLFHKLWDLFECVRQQPERFEAGEQRELLKAQIGAAHWRARLELPSLDEIGPGELEDATLSSEEIRVAGGPKRAAASVAAMLLGMSGEPRVDGSMVGGGRSLFRLESTFGRSGRTPLPSLREARPEQRDESPIRTRVRTDPPSEWLYVAPDLTEEEILRGTMESEEQRGWFGAVVTPRDSAELAVGSVYGGDEALEQVLADSRAWLRARVRSRAAADGGSLEGDGSDTGAE